MTRARNGRSLGIALTLLALPAALGSTDGWADATANGSWFARSADEMAWQGAPGGVQRVNLVGDTGQSGPFVYRVRVPSGFSADLHHHTTDLHSTILSGEVVFTFADPHREPVTLGPGSFVYVPAGLVHAEHVRLPTVMEVRGMGPTTTVAADAE